MKFPVVAEDATHVPCFHCGTPVPVLPRESSGFPPGGGAYVSGRCPKESLRTWYDLRKSEPGRKV